jgi:hypothetical protein
MSLFLNSAPSQIVKEVPISVDIKFKMVDQCLETV